MPPRGGFIPETGEQQAMALVIIGGILIALALRLLSKHRKHQNKD